MRRDGGRNRVRPRPRLPLAARGVLATLLVALGLAVPRAAAQERGESVRIEPREDRTLQPLTAEEMSQATTAVQHAPAASRSLDRRQRVRTISVERQEEGKRAPAGQRRAYVVLYNYDTNETTSAVVALGPSPRVEQLTVARDQAPSLSPAEVEDAKRRALAHPAVRAKLRAVGLAGRTQELIITHLLAKSASPGDPCATHRCVGLFFNTPDAVLDIHPVVDLTTGEVDIQ